jgi:transcriptional regulator with XRE-family HTH domain
MSIGAKIKQRRNELSWSQRDLAAKMGYNNNSTIARIEKGQVDIPQSRIVQFAEVLGVSVAYLMGWDEEIKQDPVGTAERHFEVLMDEDFVGMFDEFHSLDASERKIVKDLVSGLAKNKKTEA